MDLGSYITYSVAVLQQYTTLLIQIAVTLMIGLVLLRLITDWTRMNPFGRFYHALRKPTESMIYNMRTSQFYFPLKQSLGFDPSSLMLLIASAISGYVIYIVLRDFYMVLLGLGQSLSAFSHGSIFTGIRYAVGTMLLAVIFFLMAMMTLVFVNWIFGLLSRYARWAMERLAPLLKIFEFGGAFAGFSFLFLWIALTFAYVAVSAIFFA